jgi:hypothetical protein
MRRLGSRFVVRRFPAWLLVEGEGPYATRAAALAAMRTIVGAVPATLRGAVPSPVWGWLGLEADVLGQASVG